MTGLSFRSALLAPRPLSQLREWFPDLHKAEFLVPCSEGNDTAPEQVAGLAARCPTVHEHDIDGVIHFVETDEDNGLWSTSGCDAGCTWEAIQQACAIGRRQPGDDDGDAHTTVSPNPWGFVPLEQFLATDFPPTRWLYLNLIPAESVSVLMAAPNAGKTFMALEIAAQVAVAAATSGRSVLIVQQEGTAGAFQTRLRRAFAAVGNRGVQNVSVSHNAARDLLDDEHVAQLASQAFAAKADLLIVDSLAALSGGIDENNPKEMSALANNLRLLQVASTAAVLALHHMIKEAWKPDETPTLRHLRGHSTLPGRVDCVLALSPGDCDEEFVRFRLHCVKQRDGTKPKARDVSVAMTGPAATVEMNEVEEASAPKRKDASDPIEDLISIILESPKVPITPDNAMAAGTIAKVLGKNRANTIEACRRLERLGALGVIHGPAFSTYYRIKEAP